MGSAKKSKKKSKSLMPISKSKTRDIDPKKILALPTEEKKSKQIRVLPMENYGKNKIQNKPKQKQSQNLEKNKKKRRKFDPNEDKINNLKKERNETIQLPQKQTKKIERAKNALIEKQNKTKIISVVPVIQKQNDDSNENFGFPNVHKAFIAYLQDNGIECNQATHLVLYAKKKGLQCGYSKVVQYFKARKEK